MILDRELSQEACGAIVSEAVGYKEYSGKGDANDLLAVSKLASLHLSTGTGYHEAWHYLAAQIEMPEILQKPTIVAQNGSWYHLSDNTKHNGKKALETYLEDFP